MTQQMIDRAVARRTGESLSTVRALGFGPAGRDVGLEPEDLVLAVDCPFCGRPAAYAGRGTAGCDRCDVEFDAAPDEVYAAERAA